MLWVSDLTFPKRHKCGSLSLSMTSDRFTGGGTWGEGKNEHESFDGDGGRVRTKMNRWRGWGINIELLEMRWDKTKLNFR